jgi:D-methionine transport system ATP-binding protein
MISHQIEVIEQICNKVAIIANTKIIEQGELSEVFLNPQTSIAQKIIYSNQIKTLYDENKMLRILFNGNLDEPLIANIITACNILVSIVYADSKVIDGKVYGQVLIKLPKEEKDVTKLIKYLELHDINYEEVI